MENLSEKTLVGIGLSLARTQRMLGGLAALFRCANHYETLDQEEMEGISEILEVFQQCVLMSSRSLLDKHCTKDLREFACPEDLKKMAAVEQMKEAEEDLKKISKE